MLFVSLDDQLYKVMTDDVLFSEIHKFDAFHTRQDPLDLHKAAALTAGEIYLSYVAGDHRLGTESNPSQKHLHLFAGGVLSFIQNDESVSQRSSPHKCQRRYLDHPLFQQPGDTLVIH